MMPEAQILLVLGSRGVRKVASAGPEQTQRQEADARRPS